MYIGHSIQSPQHSSWPHGMLNYATFPQLGQQAEIKEPSTMSN